MAASSSKIVSLPKDMHASEWDTVKPMDCKDKPSKVVMGLDGKPREVCMIDQNYVMPRMAHPEKLVVINKDQAIRKFMERKGLKKLGNVTLDSVKPKSPIVKAQRPKGGVIKLSGAEGAATTSLAARVINSVLPAAKPATWKPALAPVERPKGKVVVLSGDEPSPKVSPQAADAAKPIVLQPTPSNVVITKKVVSLSSIAAPAAEPTTLKKQRSIKQQWSSMGLGDRLSSALCA